MLDLRYENGVNVMDSTDVNYDQIQSAAPKVARQLCSEYEVIDGVPWGNRGFVATSRGGATDANLKTWQRCCEDVMTRCERQGLIRDWTVTVARGPRGEYQTGVKFFDIPASRDIRVSLAPPWAI